VRVPSDGRGSDGRFAVGNALATGRAWKSTIRRLLGKGATSEDASAIASEAFKLYLAALREMPSDGPSVRSLVALQARHVALSAYYADRAVALGLDTEEGRAADEHAMKHGQRAERLTVTALDVATRFAATKPKANPDLDWLTDGGA
jgi:hypothetical protein